ncbi:zinc finger protein 217-like [Pyxicephalus adspersus]|uniref:zinc finger protein 217-like n=1 Tax=Pyxicephalus adspersus TaxID=30357 RepID=UPI003B59AEF7
MESTSTPAMEHQNILIQKIIQEGFFLPVGGSMQFSCYFCTESYNTREDIVKHMVETHHATLSESSVLCVEAEFLSAEDQQRIISGTSAEEEENDVSDCEVCGQTFPDSSDLETHMKKHKDSFIYCCNICGKRYKEQRFLKTHKKTHSSQSGGKNTNLSVPETPITINGVVQEKFRRNVTWPYKPCMDCGFIFKDKESLLEHRKENHKRSSKLAKNSKKSALSKKNIQDSNAKKITKEQFLEFLNLQPASAPVQKPAAKRKWLAELDPIVTCQAWQLATTGKLALGNGIKKENSFGDKMEADHPSSDLDGIAGKKSVKGTKSANMEETGSVKSVDGASPIQDLDENKSPYSQKSYFRTDLETHMKNYKDSFIYSCDICGRKFKEPWFLKNHKKTHSNQSGGKNKSLPVHETAITINGVVQEVTRNVTWPYQQWNDCGVICPDKEALLEHRNEKHIKDSKLAKNPTNSAPRNIKKGNNSEEKIQDQFMGLLNLQPASAPVQTPAAKRNWLAELDPFVTCQAWQLATAGKLALGNGENSFGAQVEASSDLEEIAEKESVKAFW